jgi:hypothetical protein
MSLQQGDFRVCLICGKPTVPAFPISQKKCQECVDSGKKLPKTKTGNLGQLGWQTAIMNDLANPSDPSSVPELCQKYGISLDQFYVFRDSVPDFDTKLRELAEKHTFEFELTFWKGLMNQARNGKVDALKVLGESKRFYNPKAVGSQFDGMSESDKKKRLEQLLKKVAKNEGV